MSYIGLGADDPSGDILQKLKSSKIFADAAGVDTKNLPPLLVKANAAAEKYLGVGADEAKKRAFEFLYLQTQKSLSEVFQTAAGKTVTKLVTSGADVAGYVQGIRNEIKPGQKIDPSGITNISSMSGKILGTLTDLVKGLGWIDGKIQNEIMEWSNVAVGCAASFQMGPVAGAAMCGLQVLGKLIPALSKTDSMPDVDSPRSIFVPTQGQLLIAAADAERLASVLKYKYGLTSYKTIYDNITQQLDSAGVYDHPDSGTVNEHSFFTDSRYPAINESPQRPRAAVDLRVALAALRFQGKDSPGPDSGGGMSGTPWGSTRFTLSTIASSGEGGLIGDTNTSRAISSRYIYDHDVPVQAIDAGYNRWVLIDDSKSAKNAMGLDAFKRVHELINFFAALTYHEFETGDKTAFQYVPGAGVTLPVRLYAVDDTLGDGCRHDWYDTEGCKQYGEQCWTSGERCGVRTNHCADDFRQMIINKDECAMRQLGSIRLMAALSYMHLVWMRALNPTTTMALPSHDMIGNLASVSDPAIQMNVPADVFTVNGTVAVANGQKVTIPVSKGYPSRTVGDCLQSMRIKKNIVDNLSKQAEQAAKIDNMIVESVSTNVLQQFQAGTKTAVVTGAGADALQQMIKSGALKLETLYASRKKCRDDGGAWSEAGMACTVDAYGNLTNCVPATSSTLKTYNCVPQGTPGSVSITDSMLASLPGGSGSSILPLIAIAGAGFLLMQLLKKK